MIQTAYEYDFLKSLLLTIMIEFSVLIMIVKYYLKKPVTWDRLLFAGIFPSFSTLPYLWFVLPIFFINDFTAYVWVGEISVTLVEIIILFFLLKLTWKEAFLLSVSANISSYGIGLLL
ncbi:MAG TPA: hypothetical protein EYG95_06580 [Campylobacterales bacterium]|nr:hypothetical protein [Campylobacterales bacterium]